MKPLPLILALNSGSSSLKFALFEHSESKQESNLAQALFRGQFSAIGGDNQQPSAWQ